MEKETKTDAVKISMSANVPSSGERVIGSYVSYGDRNLYPQWLYGLLNASGIHKGIINQKVDFIFGEGFDTTISRENAFLDEEDADNIIESIVTDFEVLGYAVVIFNRINNEWFIAESDSEKYRHSVNPDYIFYSDDWARGSQRVGVSGFRGVPLVHAVDDEADECALVIELPRKQSLDYFNENSRQSIVGDVYPSPSYSGGILSIMAHIEMGYYDYAESVNGFVSNTVVQLNDGKPSTEQEAREVTRKLQDIFQNRDKRGGVTFLFNNSTESAATINELNRSQNVGKYNDTKKNIAQNIMISHSVQNASLFGLEVEGAMGGTSAEEQLVAFEKFNKTYVKKRQNTIKRALNLAYLMLNGSNLGFEFLDFELANSRISEDGDVVNDSLVDEDGLREAFKKIGRPLIELNKRINVFSRSSNGESNKFAIEEFNRYKKSINFLDENMELVLQMVQDGSGFSGMMKHFTAKEIMRYMVKLRALGLVDGWEVTQKGRVEISREEDFEVLYTYEEVPGIPAVESESRFICAQLMSAGKYYTREEIEEIGKRFGVENLWRYRGGWYHNPDTHKTTRHCRHEWKQHIILK